MYWEDRLSEAEHKAASAAIEKFRKSIKSRNAQLDLYDRLTNAGCTPEEADEMINLEIDNQD